MRDRGAADCWFATPPLLHLEEFRSDTCEILWMEKYQGRTSNSLHGSHGYVDVDQHFTDRRTGAPGTRWSASRSGFDNARLTGRTLARARVLHRSVFSRRRYSMREHHEHYVPPCHPQLACCTNNECHYLIDGWELKEGTDRFGAARMRSWRSVVAISVRGDGATWPLSRLFNSLNIEFLAQSTQLWEYEGHTRSLSFGRRRGPIWYCISRRCTVMTTQ